MSRRILIVDDEQKLANAFKAILSKKGYEVYTAYDGEQALAQIGHMLPDLIFLDVQIPKLNGFDVCKKLKADPATKHVGVIFLTAMAQESDVKTGLGLGALDYLTKPFYPAAAMALLQKYCPLEPGAEGAEP